MMTDVKIYTITSEDLSPPIEGEGFCTDMVRHSDYAALEARFNKQAAEIASLKSFIEDDCWVIDPDRDDYIDAAQCVPETPTSDAWRREQMAQAHKEGAYFVANRMLAAWEAGFIEDTAKNAADIARMILTSTEFMAEAPEGDFERSFADDVLEDIAAQLRNGEAV